MDTILIAGNGFTRSIKYTNEGLHALFAAGCKVLVETAPKEGMLDDPYECEDVLETEECLLHTECSWVTVILPGAKYRSLSGGNYSCNAGY